MHKLSGFHLQQKMSMRVPQVELFMQTMHELIIPYIPSGCHHHLRGSLREKSLYSYMFRNPGNHIATEFKILFRLPRSYLHFPLSTITCS